MSSRSIIGADELNAAALDHFIHSPVNHAMIYHLASAASQVIQCDPNMMPPPPPYESRHATPPKTPSPKAVRSDDSGLPTLEEFITQLVLSSNVQVPTLMSTLVYLTRLKSRLQPMAKGLRCTTHRIFLAALILSAKYLNDSSPKNKHWANYSNMRFDGYSFGFSRTEVNLMEKQLLFLLDWDLRITEEDLYREFDLFLTPIREDLEAQYVQRMQRKKQKQRQEQARAAAWASVQAPTPPGSRDNSRSRSRQRPVSPPKESPARVVRDSVSESTPPPELAYSSSGSSSSGSSYASSLSSRQHSRSSTPLSETEADPYVAYTDSSLYESPIEIVLDMPQPALPARQKNVYRSKQLLPYELSADELREMQDGSANAKRARTGRGIWHRVFGAQA